MIGDDTVVLTDSPEVLTSAAVLWERGKVTYYLDRSVSLYRLLEVRLCMVGYQEYWLAPEPAMIESSESDISQYESLYPDASYDHEKCIYQDQSRYQNSLIGETIGQIEYADSDEKTDSHRFDNSKCL